MEIIKVSLAIISGAIAAAILTIAALYIIRGAYLFCKENMFKTYDKDELYKLGCYTVFLIVITLIMRWVWG